MSNSSYFYNHLSRQNEYSVELKACIENTVQKLSEIDTTYSKPGMLLGKIQSGKTRSFIGVIGLAFDKGYDVAIILTKGTRALAEQTYQRIKKEFTYFMQTDKIQVFDIMNLPNNLIDYELSQKIVLIVKKQKDNLARLDKALFEQYPRLGESNVLMIDDEADYASIGFSKTKNETIEIKTIAGQIDLVRTKLRKCHFLQVTATPYSLYLQPEDLALSENLTFKPVKPAFTELVPIHDRYIGGDYYFNESDGENISHYIYEEVPIEELKVLKKSDRRVFKLENALSSNKISALRSAIVNFIVGGCIRRIQDRHSLQHLKKYSFIIHTEQKKDSHEWQNEIILGLKEQLMLISTMDKQLLNHLILESYENLLKSLNLYEFYIPSQSEVIEEVNTALTKDYLMITVVNSEKDVNELLDESGQLKLRAPLNIYIGGQILDRGITIGNLIGFYYGRSPKVYQQDTVLQHSRMFGARPIEDLTVTRFYTTLPIFEAMKKIHEFDSGLREAFERGSQDNGVVFIQRDENNLIAPCSPNKVLLSSTTTLKPYKRLLPVGFNTLAKSKMEKLMRELDHFIDSLSHTGIQDEPFLIDIEEAKVIIEKIYYTYEFEENYTWDHQAFISSLEYLSKNSQDKYQNGKVWCILRTGRLSKRIDSKGKFENAPDTPKGQKGELRVAREIATYIPALILLRQKGEEDNDERGWRGSPFWWPVLVAPKNTRTVIYTSQSVND